MSYARTQEVDELHHWNNPAGIRTIIGVLNWVTPEGGLPWDLGLATGMGVCPHRGTPMGPEPSATAAPLILTVKSTDVDPAMTEFPATPANPDPLVDQYFMHVRPNNPGDHRGESVGYRVDVYLLP
jgi:hypothetical protein